MFKGKILYWVLPVLLFSFLGLKAIAQTATDANNTFNQISISSPTAASLGKFGDIPVSYHTGIPQVNIPIYTAKYGPLSIPITLSYHASGLKVQEPASWVGAGWALDAGGVITRTVVGAPDEKGTTNAATQATGHFSDYGYNNYLYTSDGKQDWQAFANGQKDGEPDLFFFNFGGYSGKFYFHDDHTPVLVPEQDLKIIPNYNGGNASIQGFTVTTPDGTQYYFGNTPGLTGTPCTEKTTPVTAQGGQSSSNVISSWYLKKVVSADGQFTMSLSYTAESYGYFTVAMFPVDGNAVGSDAYGYNLVKNIIQGVRLSRIDFAGNSVVFNPGSIRTDLSTDIATLFDDNNNTQATTLGSIQINSGTTVIKKYNFSYGYFFDNSSQLNGLGITSMNYPLQTDKYRLRLDAVQEVSGDGSISIPPHRFTYFTDVIVPRRLTFGIDHWGYYNGVKDNSTLIPTYTKSFNGSNQTINGAIRDASWPAMRGGALQKITYPTGGNTTFDFESNYTMASTTSTYMATVANMAVRQPGQSSYTQTWSFTGSGVFHMKYNSTSNYTGDLVIKDASNAIVKDYPVYPNTTYEEDLPSLAQGTYSVTLSLPGQFSPTGGATATLTQMQSQTTYGPVAVGGMRIKTMTHQDDVTSKTTVTNYSYDDNGQSYGVLYSKPVYVGIIRNDMIKNVGYWTTSGFQPSSISPSGCQTAPEATYYKSPSSIRPMATTQGYAIGYRQVKVSQTGNGYSIYQYYSDAPYTLSSNDVAVRTVNPGVCDAFAPNYPPAPLPFDFMRGELKYEGHFTENGTLVKEVNYTPVYTNNTFSTPGFIVVYKGQQMLATPYSLVSGRKTQMTTTETEYSQTGSPSLTTTTVEYYNSPYHHQLTSKTVNTSSGDNLQNQITYSQDYRIAACDAISDGWSSYTSSCNSCLATYNTKRGNCNASDTCLTNAYLSYMQCLTNARISYVSYRKTNFTNSTIPLQSSTFQDAHNAAKNGADAFLRPILQMQDNFQIAPVEVCSWKNNQLLKAGYSVFDFDAGSSVNVHPVLSQQINLSAPSSTFTATSSSSTSIVKDSRYVDEASVKFKAGQVAEVTKKDGLTHVYLYGYNNQYPVAHVTNARSNEIFFSSFEDGADWDSYLTAYDNTKSHSGQYAGRIDKATAGEQVVQANAWLQVSLTAPTKFKYSGWVYSNGPSAEIFLLMKRARETGYTTYYDQIGTYQTGKWVYLEKEFTVPADVTQMQLRMDNNADNLSVGTSVWFDDLRLHPSAATMSTYTYLPLVGMNSETDVSGKVVKYDYDALGRLKLVCDQDGNVLKTYEYHYKGQL